MGLLGGRFGEGVGIFTDREKLSAINTMAGDYKIPPLSFRVLPIRNEAPAPDYRAHHRDSV